MAFDSNAMLRQSILPGTGPDVQGLLRQRASTRLMPGKQQLPCDIGLFSDDADQLDLVEMFQDSTEEE